MTTLPRRRLDRPILAWLAAALAAMASLLHWAGGENHTHQWTVDGFLLVIAATALMGLAIGLVTMERDDPRARPMEIIGAAGAALLVVLFLAGLVLGPSTEGGAHAAHTAAAAPGVPLLDVAAAATEALLVAVLLWMQRLRGSGSSAPAASAAH